MLTNVYLQNILHVKFLYVFMIYALIYITIQVFAYLRISAVRFADNVQRNLSRYVQTVFITNQP